MSIDGQISSLEARRLFMLAQAVPAAQAIVEIGSFQGRSTMALAYGSQRGQRNRVFAIDPHNEFQGVFGGRFGVSDQNRLYQNIVAHRMGEIVAVVSLSSLAAANGWAQQNIGLLFIDGDHSYDAICADYRAWTPFLAPNACVVFHDSDMPEVRRFLRDLHESNEVEPQGEEGSLAWFGMARNEGDHA